MKSRKNNTIKETKEFSPLKIAKSTSAKYLENNCFKGNIENYMGMSEVPTGWVGPLAIQDSKSGVKQTHLPLATTEGALVASYNRGAKAITLAGGAYAVVLDEGVQRTPTFKFQTLEQAFGFSKWIENNETHFQRIAKETSRYATLKKLNTSVEGNQATVVFHFFTGDASGQNMVTFCTEAICQFILIHTPFIPQKWYVEGNYSNDKKATVRSFTQTRGKRVSAEIILPAKTIQTVLKTEAAAMYEYWLVSTMNSIQSGAIGCQGHAANGLAALFIATGQDVACVAESAIGITRMELTKEEALYVSVTLPNLMVGTVGGGTHLPTQHKYLEFMDCYGAGKANAFAKIATALVLAGEISIAAALSAGHFSNAHQTLGRK